MSGTKTESNAPLARRGQEIKISLSVNVRPVGHCNDCWARVLRLRPGSIPAWDFERTTQITAWVRSQPAAIESLKSDLANRNPEAATHNFIRRMEGRSDWFSEQNWEPNEEELIAAFTSLGKEQLLEAEKTGLFPLTIRRTERIKVPDLPFEESSSTRKNLRAIFSCGCLANQNLTDFEKTEVNILAASRVPPSRKEILEVKRVPCLNEEEHPVVVKERIKFLPKLDDTLTDKAKDISGAPKAITKGFWSRQPVPLQAFFAQEYGNSRPRLAPRAAKILNGIDWPQELDYEGVKRILSKEFYLFRKISEGELLRLQTIAGVQSPDLIPQWMVRVVESNIDHANIIEKIGSRLIRDTNALSYCLEDKALTRAVLFDEQVAPKPLEDGIKNWEVKTSTKLSPNQRRHIILLLKERESFILKMLNDGVPLTQFLSIRSGELKQFDTFLQKKNKLKKAKELSTLQSMPQYWMQDNQIMLRPWVKKFLQEISNIDWDTRIKALRELSVKEDSYMNFLKKGVSTKTNNPGKQSRANSQPKKKRQNQPRNQSRGQRQNRDSNSIPLSVLGKLFSAAFGK